MQTLAILLNVSQFSFGFVEDFFYLVFLFWFLCLGSKYSVLEVQSLLEVALSVGIALHVFT